MIALYRYLRQKFVRWCCQQDGCFPRLQTRHQHLVCIHCGAWGKDFLDPTETWKRNCPQ
jgi:hypothetical protein